MSHGEAVDETTFSSMSEEEEYDERKEILSLDPGDRNQAFRND